MTTAIALIFLVGSLVIVPTVNYQKVNAAPTLTHTTVQCFNPGNPDATDVTFHIIGEGYPPNSPLRLYEEVDGVFVFEGGTGLSTDSNGVFVNEGVITAGDAPRTITFTYYVDLNGNNQLDPEDAAATTTVVITGNECADLSAFQLTLEDIVLVDCDETVDGQANINVEPDDPSPLYGFATVHVDGQPRSSSTISAGDSIILSVAVSPGEHIISILIEPEETYDDQFDEGKEVMSSVTWTNPCPPPEPEKTPVELTQDLKATINSMNIPKSLKTSLQGPLTNAEKILTDKDPTNDLDACTKLNDFITSVNDKTGTRGGLTSAQAEELISQAQAIKEAIGC